MPKFLEFRHFPYSELEQAGSKKFHVSALSRSFLGQNSVQSERVSSDGTDIFYPRWRHPLKDVWQEHLRFAIRYEGVNLEILKAFFEKVPMDEFVNEVLSKPTGRYCRSIWFLYEYLTGGELPLDDANSGSFTPILDATKQFARSPADSEKIKRQRVFNNLPGNKAFCPMVRLTKSILERNADWLKNETDVLLSAYSPELLYRAVQYLYAKETKSSFAIERETPSRKRMATFVATIISFSFLFLRSVDDGNGRTHRPRLYFRYRRYCQKNPGIYDQMLESFSKRLMPLRQYSIDDCGGVSVKNDSVAFYRFIAMTPIVEEFQNAGCRRYAR